MEAQEVRDVLLEVMAEKGLGKTTLKVERVCALLDPWRKSLDNSQIVNGSSTLMTRAEEDLKALIETLWTSTRHRLRFCRRRRW